MRMRVNLVTRVQRTEGGVGHAGRRFVKSKE